MVEPLLFVTGLVLLATWLFSYAKTKDALHPAIFILPMMGYQYVVRPGLLYSRGQIQEFFPDESMLELSAFVHFIGVVGFCLGLLPGKGMALNSRRFVDVLRDPQTRQNLIRLGLVLGAISVVLYWYSVLWVGGVGVAYGRAKGGGMRYQSGYISEAIGLCVPAIILLFMAWRKQRLTLSQWALVGLMASPYLLTGFLGSRRGPTFMILAAMAFSWFLIRHRRVKIYQVVATIVFICICVVFLFVNRPRLYIGSKEGLRFNDVFSFLSAEGTSTGDDYVAATALINVHHSKQKWGWGRGLVVTFLIRPIPKQFWPTKYQDAQGVLYSEREMVTPEDYLDTVGWIPPSGRAVGGVADLFKEFYWFVPCVMFLYGRFYRLLWQKARLQGGVWTCFYILGASLSIYIPTQSMSAVFHRFLYLSVFLSVFWKLFVGPFQPTNFCGSIPGPAVTYRKDLATARIGLQ